MRKMIFAAMLLLLTARGAQAAPFEFKSYSFANYGSPFRLILNTADDLDAAISGGPAKLFGAEQTATLFDLLQEGPTSHSDEYNTNSTQRVAFSAAAIYNPADPLSTDSPKIGAKNFSVEHR